MEAVRIWLWAVGITFMIGGSVMLYFAAGLGRWFALGVLTAGLVVLAGRAVVRFGAAALANRPTLLWEHEDVVECRTMADDARQTGGR